MSVHVTHYVMLGIRKPYRWVEAARAKYGDVFVDSFRDSSDRAKAVAGNNLYVIVDGMDCDYVVIGNILAKADEDEPFTFTSLESYDLIRDKVDFAYAVNEVFKDLGPGADEVSLHIFSHYR